MVRLERNSTSDVGALPVSAVWGEKDVFSQIGGKKIQQQVILFLADNGNFNGTPSQRCIVNESDPSIVDAVLAKRYDIFLAAPLDGKGFDAGLNATVFKTP
jgi:hypothetical protein